MARTFNGSGDDLTVSVGGLSAMTYGTVAVLLRYSSTGGAQGLFNPHPSGGGFLWAVAVSVNVFEWFVASSSAATTTLTAGTWYCMVVRKATGSATPRFSWYNYTTNTWVHENGSIATADGTSPGAGGTINCGSDTSDFLGCDLAVRAAWSNSVKWTADATGDNAIVDSGLHTSLQAWHAAAPTALWVYDQQATGQKLLDLAGSGANESAISGTSVSTNSVPAFTYGFDSMVPQSVAAPAPPITDGPPLWVVRPNITLR